MWFTSPLRLLEPSWRFLSACLSCTAVTMSHLIRCDFSQGPQYYWGHGKEHARRCRGWKAASLKVTCTGPSQRTRSTSCAWTVYFDTQLQTKLVHMQAVSDIALAATEFKPHFKHHGLFKPSRTAFPHWVCVKVLTYIDRWCFCHGIQCTLVWLVLVWHGIALQC